MQQSYCTVMLFSIVFLGTVFLSSVPASGEGGSYFNGGTVHIISSSHQDIGWMDSPEKCIEGRDNLVITPALERMRENPDFRFVMESVMNLMEYLERHPESKNEIIRYTKEGRFEWGATYNQPYESMYNDEALVRQTYLGRKWLKKHLPGCDTRTAWSPDVPGRAMQMPQILAKSGIPYLIMSRHEKGIYRWQSPDGSGVIAYSPGHYHASGEIFRKSVERGEDHTTIITKPKELAEVRESLLPFLLGEESYYASHSVPPEAGIISSTDFSGPVDLDVLFSEWNSAVDRGYYGENRTPFAMPRLTYATGESFLSAVSEKNPRFPVITGERPNVWLYIHGPAHHRALSAGREAAHRLTEAEMFATVNAVLDGNLDSYPAETLEQAWADAIYPDHGWGGYNGKITDRLFRTKMESGRDTADALLKSSLRAIADRVAVKDMGIPIVVFNSLSWERTDPVTVSVNVEGMDETGFKILDSLGRAVEYQIISGRSDGRESDEELRLLFIADAVPPIGYKTYYAVTEKGDSAQGTPTGNPETVIENRFYRVELAPGGIRQIHDKILGESILRTDKFLGGELFTMKSEGNGAGEFSEVQLPTMEGFEKLSQYAPRWMCLENGLLRSVYETAHKLNHCTARVRITLYNTIKRMDIDVDLLGWDGTNSREFRLAFPLAMDSGTVAYKVPMGVLEVGKDEIAGAAGERYVQPCAEVHPREVTDWFHASNGDFGVTISSSVAVFDWIDPTDDPVSYPVLQPVLLASRRSCHGEGNWYLQAGDHSYHFELTSHRGDWHEGYRSGIQANRPLAVVMPAGKSTEPLLPETLSFCSVSADNVIVSTVKKCEDDDSVIVRCYDIEGKDTRAAVRWFTPVIRAEVTNLIEEEGVEIPVENGQPELAVGHHSIETCKLDVGKWNPKKSAILPPPPPLFDPPPGLYEEPGIDVRLTVDSESTEIRYTLDGSDPGPESSLYEKPLVISGHTTVHARAYKNGVTASQPVTGEFHAGLNNPVNAGDLVNGLSFNYYEGSWDKIPDFASMTSVETGVTDNFGIERRARDEQYGFRFAGFIDIPRDGIYSFATESDDGSKLHIDGRMIVDNDGMHWPKLEEGRVGLKKGMHVIAVDFIQGGGGQSLKVLYSGPETERREIPASTLFRSR